LVFFEQLAGSAASASPGLNTERSGFYRKRLDRMRRDLGRDGLVAKV
jgi:hypothetical protein